MINNNLKIRIGFVLLLLPLLFINVKNTHDWGDDFAQYLIQARNIIEEIPQTENGLIFEESKAYAIQAYPVGFPLLLSPIYFFSALEISSYTLFISFILIITAFLCFEFFKSRTSVLSSIFLALLFCYNPNILDFKKYILSEIPFTMNAMMLFIWVATVPSQKKFSWLITGLLLSFLVSFRLPGITFVIAFAAYSLFRCFRQTENKKRKIELRNLILTIITFVIAFLLLNDFIFQIKTKELIHFYGYALNIHGTKIGQNLSQYYNVLGNLFPFPSGGLSKMWIFIVLAGFALRFRRAPELPEFCFAFYVGLILFYPYSDAGIRFFIPVIPLMIYYLFYFTNSIFQLLHKNYQIISKSFLALILLTYIMPLKRIIATQSSIEYGPNEQNAVEMFSHLKTTPKDASIVFGRARAMSLYSGHQTLYIDKLQSNQETFEQFKKYSTLFIVITNDFESNKNIQPFDSGIKNYLSEYGNYYDIVWENDGYRIYRQKYFPEL